MKIENMAALRVTLEGMQTPQLDAMLLEELRKDPPNAKLIRLVSGILKERDKDLIPEIDDNTRQAWEAYQRKTEPVHKKPRVIPGILVKAASLILVVLTLTAFLPQKAEATNFFRRLIAWTEDVFSFMNPSEEAEQEDAYAFQTDTPGLQQIYDKVTELGITDPVVPMWLPEGYELVNSEFFENPSQKYLIATFSNGLMEVIYQVKLFSDNTSSAYYKDGEKIAETEKHGITHTILRNQDLLTATWTKDNIECSIFIDCQEDTLIRILESIYTMEDN